VINYGIRSPAVRRLCTPDRDTGPPASTWANSARRLGKPSFAPAVLYYLDRSSHVSLSCLIASRLGTMSTSLHVAVHVIAQDALRKSFATKQTGGSFDVDFRTRPARRTVAFTFAGRSQPGYARRQGRRYADPIRDRGRRLKGCGSAVAARLRRSPQTCDCPAGRRDTGPGHASNCSGLRGVLLSARDEGDRRGECFATVTTR
jgi:hypothetical protein